MKKKPIDFSKRDGDSITDSLNPLERLAADATRKTLIEIEVQCVPQGIMTCITVDAEIMDQATPKELDKLENALEDISAALDDMYTNNKAIVKYLMTINGRAIAAKGEK